MRLRLSVPGLSFAPKNNASRLVLGIKAPWTRQLRGRSILARGFPVKDIRAHVPESKAPAHSRSQAGL